MRRIAGCAPQIFVSHLRDVSAAGGHPIWHHAPMLELARAILVVLADFLRLGVLFLRSASDIRAENLAPRKQLAAYIERGIRPRQLDHASRVSLSVLARLFSWRDAIVI